MARKQTGLSLKLPDYLFGDINHPFFIGVCFIQKTSLMVKTDLVLERVKGF
jgi:hypothetical protein